MGNEKTIKSNFWYVLFFGDYASGMWCPFETKEKAVKEVKKHLKEEYDTDNKIVFEGLDKYRDYMIKFEYGEFDRFIIKQRKDGEILEQSYIE